MGQLDFISMQFANKKKDYTSCKCPYCNYENNMNATECVYCGGELTEFNAIVYSRFNLYNEALDFCKEEKYVSALEKIKVFLEFYPNDIDAKRLYLYILYKLNDVDFEKKAEDIIRLDSDRWIASFIDNPKEITIGNFQNKEQYKGKINLQIENKFVCEEQLNQKLAQNLLDTINSYYSIYVRSVNYGNKSKNKNLSEFITFYEKVFELFLKKNNIYVINYLGKNINSLPEENIKVIGNIAVVENKKMQNGQIVEVYFPEIRYRNFILQKAKITVVKNKENTKEKK